jgi:hypothetical protein
MVASSAPTGTAFANSPAGRSVSAWRTTAWKELAMPPQTLESRLERLEKRVTRLEQLPGRLDDLTSQVSQLRTEMRAEFSAVRHEFTATMAEQVGGLATQMRVLHEDVIGRIALLQEGLSGASKRRPKKK